MAETTVGYPGAEYAREPAGQVVEMGRPRAGFATASPSRTAPVAVPAAANAGTGCRRTVRLPASPSPFHGGPQTRSLASQPSRKGAHAIGLKPRAH